MSEAKQSFPRNPRTGLVDLDAYLRYLPDPPDRVPIDPPKFVNSPWVRQHVYFEAAQWKKAGVEHEGTQSRLSAFRNHWSNQIIMRRKKEQKVHRDFEDHVEPPPFLIIDMGLEELNHLDRIGAATLGRDIALHPERVESLKNVGPPKNAQDWSVADRLELFDNIRANSLQALESTKVTPEILVISGIIRLSKLLDEPGLIGIAEERRDGKYLPVHTPSLGNLYALSNVMLRDACNVVPFPQAQEIAA